MKKIIPTLTLLTVFFLFPFFSGCSEPEPAGIFLPEEEIILNPGSEITLEVKAFFDEDSRKEPEVLTEDLLFFSSREELLSVDPGGSIRIRTQVINSGKVLSGETAEIHVRYRDLKASCRVLIVENPDVTVDPLGFLLNPAGPGFTGE